MKIERPRFLSGTVLANDTRLKPYERRPRSLRERVWRPSNFQAAPIAPRHVPDFDRIRALDEKSDGLKIQLGDSTLAKLLDVEVPDPSDVSWLTEKARRMGLGETEAQIAASPPFGREQKTMTKRTNLGDAKLSTDAQLQSVDVQIQAVQAALAQGSIDVAAIGAVIAQIVVGQTTTNQQIGQLAAASQMLGIPKDWRQAGLTHRLWSQAQFRADEGKIMLFLLANIPQGFDDNKNFLVRVDDKWQGIASVSVRSVASKLKDQFLDVENRAVIPIDLAKDLVFNHGADNGQLDLPVGQPTPPRGGPPSNTTRRTP